MWRLLSLPWRDVVPLEKGPSFRRMSAEAECWEEQAGAHPRQPETGLWRGCLCQGLEAEAPTGPVPGTCGIVSDSVFYLKCVLEACGPPPLWGKDGGPLTEAGVGVEVNCPAS